MGEPPPGSLFQNFSTTVDKGYGEGRYEAWANSIYDYGGGDEWPPSGAFDWRTGDSHSGQGYHTKGAQNENVAPAILGLSLPRPIELAGYRIKARAAPWGGEQQAPKDWVLEGYTSSGEWKVAHTVKNARFSRGEIKVYETGGTDCEGNALSFSKLRFKFKSSFEGHYLSLVEINFKCVRYFFVFVFTDSPCSQLTIPCLFSFF